MATKNTNNNVIVFLDNIGRTLIGNKLDDTATHIAVQNPALVHINANPQNNQLQLQILPLFFREFQADKTEPTVWNFNKSSITLSNSITFGFQFLAQYEQMFQVTTEQPEGKTEIVKLFDEEESK
tara:strand:+ start:1831 stop:2205 length:375 start_codon:yes stop_codon:yes gene_type:complete